MTAYLGLALLDLLLLAAGLGVLVGLGQLDASPRSLAAGAGLGFLTGLASVLMLAITLMSVGVPFGPITVTVLSLVLGVGGALLAHRRGGLRPSPAASEARSAVRAGVKARLRAVSADRWAVVAFASAFGAFALVGFADAAVTQITGWDAWTMWARKATVLYYFGGLPPEFFAVPENQFASPDYPLLLPAYEAISFRAMGGIDTQTMHVQLWALLVAFGWALAGLAHRVVRPVVWAPLVLLALLAPGAWGALLTAYADVPMAIFLCLGALCLGLWISRRRTPDLALAAVLLAGAASTKNEGLMAAVAVLGVAAAVVALERRGLAALRPMAVAAGALVALVLPWRLWAAFHGIEGQIPVAQGLNPLYLAGRIERVIPSIRALVDSLDDQEAFTYLLPLGVGVAAICLATGVARGVAAYYLGSMAAVSALLVWAYWIAPTELAWHLETSVGRVSTGVVFVGVAGLLHLAGELHAFGTGEEEAEDGDGLGEANGSRPAVEAEAVRSKALH